MKRYAGSQTSRKAGAQTNIEADIQTVINREAFENKQMRRNPDKLSR